MTFPRKICLSNVPVALVVVINPRLMRGWSCMRG